MYEENFSKDDPQWRSCFGCCSVTTTTLYISAVLGLRSGSYTAISVATNTLFGYGLTAACLISCICPVIAIWKTKPALITPLLFVIGFSMITNIAGALYFLLDSKDKLPMLTKMILASICLFFAWLDYSSFSTAKRCAKYLEHKALGLLY